MCGIAGYLNLNGQPLNPDERLLEPMCHSISHRGPDDTGTIIIGSVALGMTRLSIIDLKTGHQPISNEDGSVWIIFNGEIYNFQELQEKLLSRGHRLATRTDTETVVHLYEEYGVDCLRFLEGMFAFAIWDHQRQRLFIARDRMGEKPLHYGIFAGQFVFSSEIKGILAHPRAQKELNPVALQKYLALEYVPAPTTIFQGIEKLLPGHFLLVEGGRAKARSYWEPDTTVAKVTEGEAQETLVRLLKESVRLRLISDVPLGVFLSGGVDSSSIAALACQLSSEPVKTYSIGFADQSFDESDYARQVARHLGTDHHVAIFEPNLALTTLEELWDFLDEPLGDASIIPTFFLSKMTRRHVTVALAGEGGDELFGGYPTYQAHRLAYFWKYVPKAIRRGLIEPMIRTLPVNLNNLSFDYKVKRFIASAEEPPVRRHLRWMGAIPVSEHNCLIRPEWLSLTSEGDLYPGLGPFLSMNPGLKGDNDLISTVMQVDMNTYLPDDLLVKSDRASMAASLEVRLPFLAHPLVSFSLALPSSMKVKGFTTKYLLKKAMQPYLPKDILYRPKKGFGIPVAKWLKKEFYPMVQDLLSEDFVAKQGIFHYRYIKQMLDEHYSNKADRRKEIWTVLQFQFWWNKFFAAKTTEAALR